MEAEVSMEVTTSVEQVMGQLLTNVEDISEQEGAGPSPEDTTLASNLKSPTSEIKMEEESSTDGIPRPSPGTGTQDSSSDGPLVIDLSDDDEEIYSKENIERTPAKSLTGLVKNLASEPTADIVGKIKLAITKLPREVLEEMFCTKIGECIELDKCVRKLELKVNNFIVYKDRVLRKVTLLDRQSLDMAKAMQNVTENMTRNPKNAQKAFTPIKFLRTIGVQCRTDPLPRLKPPLGTSKSMNTPPPPLAVTTKVIETNRPNGVIQPPMPITTITPQKRLNKPTVNVSGIINQIQPGLPPAKMRRPGPGPASRQGTIPIHPKSQQNPNGGSGVNRGDGLVLTNGSLGTTTASPSNNVNGLIDIGSPDNNGNGRRIVINQNGVQYRVGSLPSGVQIVTSTAGGYQLVASQGQGRSVLVQQPQPLRPGVTAQIVPRQQNIVLRNGTPTLPVTVNVPTRQYAPRVLATPVNTNNSSTAVGVRYLNPAQHNVVTSTLPKFILPELPVMSPQPKKPKESPPRPTLTLQEQGGGIVLSWTHIMSYVYAEIQSYQIYACQEPVHYYPGKILPTPQWKRVGDVKALPLPMACTLSQFTDESRYHFIVRGVDVYNRTGPFCECMNILLKKKIK